MRWSLLVLGMLASCSGGRQTSVVLPDASAATPTTVPASGLPVREGFEADVSGWKLGGEGYDVAVAEGGHESAKALRLAFREPGKFGFATRWLTVGDAVGKHLVLSGWVKTEAVTTGYAGLWLRVDGERPGEILAMENMSRDGLKGTTPWTHLTVELDVPEKGKRIYFGALLDSDGTAWVDDLELAAAAPGPKPLVTVGGVTRDAAGKAIGGALVAVVPPTSSKAAARTTSGADGRFTFTVPAGSYSFTATAPGQTAAYRPMALFGASTNDVEIVLGGAGFTVRGTVRVAGAGGAKTTLAVTRISQVDGDLFYVATDAAGAFTVKLPTAEGYELRLEDDKLVVAAVSVTESKDQSVELIASRLEPAPDEVVAWIKATAIPIATADPAHAIDDLERLGAIVGPARVVALGEATHGTREFFQLKHRVFEYLVDKLGFTVFAIEANYPESLAVNDYVLHGVGDPKVALKGMYFWTWNTEEVLELIEWMRRWNADPLHKQQLQFLGFDMQTAFVAVATVLVYLAKVDPSSHDAVAAALAPLASEEAERSFDSLPAPQRAATAKAIADLLGRFDAEKPAFVARSSAREWAIARQHLVVVSQNERLRSRPDVAFGWRDESMAANVRWILDQEPKGTRMMLWAHNAHVNLTASAGIVPMGTHLAKAFGADYLVTGFVFDRGAFQAIASGALNENRLGEAPVGDIANPFHRTGLPMLALDLRHPPAGAVAGWLAAPHPMRETGAVFTTERAMTRPVTLPARFHAVLYVDETTRARPVAPATQP